MIFSIDSLIEDFTNPQVPAVHLCFHLCLFPCPEPRLVGVGGFGSGDVTAPEVVSVDGVCCDGRGVDCFGSRWRIAVGAGKMPGCGCEAGAGPPRARAHRHRPPSFSYPRPPSSLSSSRVHPSPFPLLARACYYHPWRRQRR